MSDREATIGALRGQADWCGRIGSPLYAALLEEAARDVEAGGPVWDALRDDPAPAAGMLPLRLTGAVHRLALEGRAPALAAHLPSTGGDGDAAAAWPAFRAVVVDEAAAVRELLARPVQTNEVGRAAALLPGFLTVAHETGLPLRLLEVGTSAGLNLRWDRFHYRLGTQEWGDPASPVRLAPAVDGEAPALEREAPPLEREAAPLEREAAAAGKAASLDGGVSIAERRGCDRAPVDPTSDEGRLTLLSFTWPDQLERFERLRGAFDVARALPVVTERADAVDWLGERLAEPARGVATVVFHSVVIQYLPREARAALAAAIEDAGRRASAEAPLAWLRMEPGGEQAEVRLTRWPGGEGRLLAAVDFHVSRLRFAAAQGRAAQDRA